MDSLLMFSEHAIDRMLDWGLDVADVQAAFDNAETIEEYADGARLLLGRAGVRPLHLVVRPVGNGEGTFMITVYEPTEDRWDSGFTRRRR